MEISVENETTQKIDLLSFGFTNNCFESIENLKRESAKTFSINTNCNVQSDGSFFLRIKTIDRDTIIAYGYYSNGSSLIKDMHLIIEENSKGDFVVSADYL